MNVWGLIAVKRFEAGKSRLSEVLDQPARPCFARSLFEHVFGVLSSTPTLAGVAVVTDCDKIASLVRSQGAIAVRDPIDVRTLAAAVDAGLDRLAELGADAALVFMGDLPELTRSDVEMLCGELRRADVVVVSDERGVHTNALGMRLGARQPTHFGTGDSYRRHCQMATRAGLTLATPSSRSIAFDVDTPSDFLRWMACAPGRRFIALDDHVKDAP